MIGRLRAFMAAIGIVLVYPTKQLFISSYRTQKRNLSILLRKAKNRRSRFLIVVA